MSEIKHISEVMREVMQNRRSFVTIEDGWITIQIPDNQNTYDIELKRIDTPKRLLGWCDHLGRKRWVTKELLREFIVKVAATKQWEIHPI